MPETVCGASTGEAAWCPSGGCRPECSLEVIQQLLGEEASVSGEDADRLLDLHQFVKGRSDAEATLQAFCELRRRLERRYYLAFYRLRRWLEAHVVAEVKATPQDSQVSLPLRLDFYCVEAVRRGCLCRALEQGLVGNKLGLTFRYRRLMP